MAKPLPPAVVNPRFYDRLAPAALNNFLSRQEKEICDSNGRLKRGIQFQPINPYVYARVYDSLTETRTEAVAGRRGLQTRVERVGNDQIQFDKDVFFMPLYPWMKPAYPSQVRTDKMGVSRYYLNDGEKQAFLDAVCQQRTRPRYLRSVSIQIAPEAVRTLQTYEATSVISLNANKEEELRLLQGGRILYRQKMNSYDSKVDGCSYIGVIHIESRAGNNEVTISYQDATGVHQQSVRLADPVKSKQPLVAEVKEGLELQ